MIAEPSETAAKGAEAHGSVQANADLPAGDSPPRPTWPLVIGVGVWICWVGFLAAMMVIRMRTTAV